MEIAKLLVAAGADVDAIGFFSGSTIPKLKPDTAMGILEQKITWTHSRWCRWQEKDKVKHRKYCRKMIKFLRQYSKLQPKQALTTGTPKKAEKAKKAKP